MGTSDNDKRACPPLDAPRRLDRIIIDPDAKADAEREAKADAEPEPKTIRDPCLEEVEPPDLCRLCMSGS